MLAVIAFDMAQVLGFFLIFFCYLSGIDSSGWMVFSTTALVFLAGLGLRLISGSGIMGLSLVF